MRSFLLFHFLFSFLVASGQEEKQAGTPARTSLPAKASVEMSNGKAWLIVDGKTTLLREEISIGKTKVYPDGAVVTPDGKKLRLKNGDKVNEDGSLQTAADKMKEPGSPSPPDKQP